MAAATQSVSGAVNPTNGAKALINEGVPYTATITVTGSADLLFHAWNCESIEEKANTAKGSNGRKSDDVESFVYRNDKSEICMPSEYLRMAIVNAAKYKQDPRSPRKSAMDLFKAGIVAVEPLVPMVNAQGKKTKVWDVLHKCRVTIMRNGITRCRPCFHTGWQVTVAVQVQIPEYITPELLNEVVQMAGRLVGVGDFRPTYGRFQVIGFEVKPLA